MTDTVMDFKAALLKRQPSATTGNVFKPTTGDASTNGKKEQDGRPTIPFNAPEDEGRDAAMKRMRNRPRRRYLDASTRPARAMFDVNMLPTIIETGPTPPMTSESPCVESWTYVSPTDRSALTALQAIALRARDRLASRIQAEFAPQGPSAVALTRLRDQVFAQLQCQLDVVTAPTPTQPIIIGESDTNGLHIQLKDSEAKDEQMTQLKEALEKEKEEHAKTKQEVKALSGSLLELRDELGAYQRHLTVLEKAKEEMSLKVQEQEATIEAFGKPRIGLSRSSSGSSSASCADSDHVVSSSSMSSVSPASSERELAFSSFNTLALRRKATGTGTGSAAATATLAPPKPASLGHRRGSSLQHTATKPGVGVGPRPLSNVSNVVKSEYGYLSFTIPSKSGDGQTDDPRTLTGTPVGSFELSHI